MKQIVIAGNLTRDAELRRLQDGTPVLGFSVAVNDRKKEATFFDCSLFGKRGESLEPYLNKGGKVTVMGEFSPREHDGKTYLQVRVNEVAMQGSNQAPDRDTAPENAPDTRPESGGGFGGGHSPDLDDTEIPF